MSGRRPPAQPRDLDLRFLGFAVWIALALTGACDCDDEESAEKSEDGGASPHLIEDKNLGFKMMLAPGWVPVPELPPSAEGVKTIADVRRAPPEKRAFTVTPRLVVTTEATLSTDPNAVFRETMDDLKGIGKKPGVQVERMSLSRRAVGGIAVGDIEMSYVVKFGEVQDGKMRTGGPGGTEVVHRSLISLRPGNKGELSSILVFTVTFLEADGALVASETQAMLQSLHLFQAGEEPSSEPTEPAEPEQPESPRAVQRGEAKEK